MAAARGHQVELRERGPKLGGQLLLASKPPGKEEIDSFTKYLEGEVNRLGVKVKTNAPVTPADIKRLSPDVTIMATGSMALRPPIPGIDKDHVVTAIEILQGTKDVKNKVVVLGGGMVGAEVAEYLATRGKDVTLVEMLKQVASDMPSIPRDLLILALKENNVKVITEAKAEEIADSSVFLSKRSEKLVIPADNVVLALGTEPDTSLKDKLGGQLTLWVGDCVKPRKILDAVREGFDAGTMV